MVRWYAIAPLLLVWAACGSAHFNGEALQPNPLAVTQPDLLRESRKVRIRVRDMEVPRGMAMYNTASFSVVNKNRLRFHVELVHKWEEYVDVRGWRAHLEDDAGHVWRPVPGSLDQRAKKGVNKVWDEEQRTVIRDENGNFIRYREDGWKQRIPLVSLDLFRGRGDVVFAGKGLLTRDVHRLTLVLEKGGVELRFTWNLFDPEDPATGGDAPPPVEVGPEGGGADEGVLGRLTHPAR